MENDLQTHVNLRYQYYHHNIYHKSENIKHSGNSMHLETRENTSNLVQHQGETDNQMMTKLKKLMTWIISRSAHTSRHH